MTRGRTRSGKAVDKAFNKVFTGVNRVAKDSDSGVQRQVNRAKKSFKKAKRRAKKRRKASGFRALKV